MKRERRTLLASLAALKNDQGKGGSELQQEDIGRLRRELEAKKEKVNELRLVSVRSQNFCECLLPLCSDQKHRCRVISCVYVLRHLC